MGQEQVSIQVAFQTTVAIGQNVTPSPPLLPSCAHSGAAGRGSLGEGPGLTVGAPQAELEQQLGVRGPKRQPGLPLPACAFAEAADTADT